MDKAVIYGLKAFSEFFAYGASDVIPLLDCIVMSSDIVISVENLGKKYSLGHRPTERYTALRDVLARAIGSSLQNISTLLKQPAQAAGPVSVEGPPSGRQASDEEFWALQNVSFEIRRGDVVGIIGRNGAGKSTLLKILSRITEPTAGKVRIKGRIASLLEVGTGFHPELTGRENIYLNGAILGMSRAEIRSKFDEIVAFSEVEKFLDTPVKRYSSGMYVRLAFAVAAHLEPEILVVDEVLAVGDAEFQKKCLGKMSEVARHGRTVLFVSHNLSAVKSLTTSGIILQAGKLRFRGSTDSAVDFYSRSMTNGDGEPRRRLGSGTHTTIEAVRMLDQEGRDVSHYTPGAPLILEIAFITDGSSALSFEIFLLDANRSKLALASLHQFQGITLPNAAGKYVCHIHLQPLWLASGSYALTVTSSLVNHGWDHYVEDAITFDVLSSNPLGFPWDFKYSYSYGAFAMLCQEPPSFTRTA